MTDKPRKVSVLLPESDFQHLERFCRQSGHKKSTLIAHLIRVFLGEQDDSIPEAAAAETKDSRTS